VGAGGDRGQSDLIGERAAGIVGLLAITSADPACHSGWTTAAQKCGATIAGLPHLSHIERLLGAACPRDCGIVTVIRWSSRPHSAWLGSVPRASASKRSASKQFGQDRHHRRPSTAITAWDANAIIDAAESPHRRRAGCGTAKMAVYVSKGRPPTPNLPPASAGVSGEMISLCHGRMPSESSVTGYFQVVETNSESAGHAIS